MKDPSPIVEEVRSRAAEISRRFGDDLVRYAEHLKEVQDRVRDRVVDQITVVPTKPTEPPSNET